MTIQRNLKNGSNGKGTMALLWLRTKALVIDAIGIALVYRALGLFGFSRTSLASNLICTATLWTYFAAMESSQ